MRTLSLERIRTLAIALFTLSIAGIPAPSLAQEGAPISACPTTSDGCHEEGVEFHYREGFFDSFSYDTGWIPEDSPLQVRFAIAGGGETEIDLAGTSVVWWPAPLSIAVPGVAGSGRLSIDYGLEIVARVRFDVTVGGTQYEWEGDIPIPGDIPRDLRLAAMMGFDSMLLPPQMPRPVAIADSASPILLAFDALGSIIPIPGISGGFEVAIQPRLEAGYRTTRVEVGDAMLPIELEGGSTVATADAGETGFGAAKDVVITPVGQLDYDGVVGLRPSLFIAIAGQRFELPIAELDVPLVVLDREIRFDPETVHVPLPDLRIEPRTVRFGEVELGVTGTALLEIRNEGEAPLHVTPRMARVPFGAPTAEVVVAPRSTRSIELTFSPDELGPVSAMLFVESNDPDESTVIVRLEGVGVASTSPDAGISTDGAIGGPSTAGGCACRAAGGAGGSPLGASGLAVSVLLLLTVRRRR